MATIYLPEDPRARIMSEALARGGAAFMQQQDATRRSAAMQQMVESGNQDPFALAKIAAGNPQSEALLKDIWGQQQAQVLAGLHQAETEKTRALTKMVPLQMAAIQTKQALERSQAELAEKHGALADAQAALTKYTAAKDLAGIREANAHVTQIEQDIKTSGITQQLLQKQLDAMSGVLGDASGAEGTPNAADPAGPTAKPGFSPTAYTGPQAQPTSGTLKPAPMVAPQDAGLGPNYDLNTDPTEMAIKRVDRASKALLPPGQRLSVKGFSQSSVQVPQQTQDKMATVEAFQQTISELQQRIAVDDKGNLKLGPLSGPLQRAMNAFKKDPNDPSVVMNALFGHLTPSQFALMTGTRAGFRMTGLIQGILADASHGSANALVKLKQSARLLRSEIGTVASEMAGKYGGNLDALHEVNDRNKETLMYDYKAPWNSVDDVSRLGITNKDGSLITEDDINTTLQHNPQYTRSELIKLLMQSQKKDKKGGSGSSSGDTPFSGE